MISTPTDRRRPAARTRSDVQPAYPPISRPTGLARAAVPAPVPEPQHHHLPSWVRRAHAQARPILGDQIAALSGDLRDEYEQRVQEFVERVSSGKFSQAFGYAQLIADGQKLVDQQRTDNAEVARAQRALDTARKRAGDALRDAGDRLGAETSARLNRELRAATDPDAVRGVEGELRQALGAVRGVEERRREREISRTRSRIEKSTPRGAVPSEPAQDWQDVLRKLQEQMAAEERV